MSKRHVPSAELLFAQSHLLLGWELGAQAQQSQIGFGPRLPDSEPPAGTLAYSKNPEGHCMTWGPTGSGKGRSAAMVAALTYAGSMIILDTKGEILAVTGKRRRQMGQQVVVLDPMRKTGWPVPGSFNPLDLYKITGASVEDIAMEVPQHLRGGQTSGGAGRDQTLGDFWDVRADGLIAGVIALVILTGATPEERTLIAVRDILMGDDPVYRLATELDKHGKQLPALAYQHIASFLSTTDVTRSGILATAIERFSPLFIPGVELSLSSTSFDPRDIIAGKPITLYLCIPPEKLYSHGRLLRLWLSALLSILQARTCRPALPTLVLVDEAGQLGSLDALRVGITLLRGYGVRFWIFWQDLTQMKRLYVDWETLLNNSTVQILGVNTQFAARAVAEVTGSAFTADEILNLPPDQAVVIEHGRSRPVRKLNYLADPLFRDLASPNPMYASQSRE